AAVPGRAGRGAGNEGGAGGEGQGGGQHGQFRRAVGRRRGDESLLAGGRVLALGQGIDLVVLDDVGQVDVAAAGVDEVVAADAVGVAVAVDHEHRHLRVREAEAGRDGQGPAVD